MRPFQIEFLWNGFGTPALCIVWALFKGKKKQPYLVVVYIWQESVINEQLQLWCMAVINLSLQAFSLPSDTNKQLQEVEKA